MAKKYDWSKFEKIGMYEFTPEELNFVPEPEVQPKWKIPEKVGIQCALSGGGSHITPKQNPNHPGGNLDNILESADEAIKEGPTVVHFDHDLSSCRTRDGKIIPVDESYSYVIKPVLKKYGREKVLPHINCLRGTFEQQMQPVVNGLAELTYMHPKGSIKWLNTTIPILKENGVKPEIVIHTNAEIDLAERILIKSGLLPNPNLWILLHGTLNRGPRFFREYMPNERAMCQALLFVIERIKEIDPGGFITICCAGRASKYLVTLALLLGINIRMGHEDTVWHWPHKDEKIKSNAEEVRWAVTIARMLGREVMTPNEFRQIIGLKPRHDFLPEGMK
ncbi:MAG: 3-keto-5-aminohexanoate cleavage protein [Methanotrichaceae archaeon]|nr:3-keto-5-aminohexanoate cleavage protein [Methanotrichaceae archaeon]